MEAEEIIFKNECEACPEAYMALHNEVEVGYVRLRWGILVVTAGKYVSIFANDRAGCEEVYSYNFNDPYKGMFDTDEERDYYLKEAAIKIANFYSQSVTA